MTTTSGVHQWYIARDGKQTGPISDPEIGAIAAHGYFRVTDLVWRAGFSEWQPALQVFPPHVAPIVVPPSLPSVPTVSPATVAPAPVVSEPNLTTQPSAHPHPAQHSVGHSAAIEAAPSRTSPGAGPTGDARRLPLDRPGLERQQGQPISVRPFQSTQESQPSAAPSGQPATAGPEVRANLALARQDKAPESETAAPMAKQQPRANRMAVAALLIFVAALAGGIWVAASPGLLSKLKSSEMTATQAATVVATTPLANDSQTAALDLKLQKSAHWPVIKREFPDWYGERLRDAMKLTSEQKSEDEVAKSLVDEMIALRKKNATLALSASTPRLKTLAGAFLDNLRSLKKRSTTECFNFISQGESAPAIRDMVEPPASEPSAIQRQIAAIFEAIADGRKNPVTHERPIKADYDILMEHLTKLGWTQTDVATFADPRALAKAPPERVCQMVEDWFVAHISIVDPGAQERLLGGTLRPVVSG
jgi:hypothetical protein